MKPTDKLKLEAQKENFAEKKVNKISSNPVLSDSVCLHLMTYVDDDNFWKCCQCNEIVD